MYEWVKLMLFELNSVRNSAADIDREGIHSETFNIKWNCVKISTSIS